MRCWSVTHLRARSRFSVNMATNMTVNAVESPEEQRAEIKGKMLLFWHNSLTDRRSAPLGQQKLSAVAGNIPAWLQGTLIRNGPGIFTVGDTSYQHFFDGMAIMHSFTFRDGGSLFFFFLINQRQGDSGGEERKSTFDL